MQDLKQKIKNTTLLSDEDKIAILVAVDGYGEADIQALEKIIDEFDAAHTQAVADYKKAVYETLDGVVAKQKPEDVPSMQAATAQIKTGVDALLSA
ncbi:MAG: hypothetical protein Q8L37_03075 [Candidatus Gottesmanbacteria bacterium]|nr:hypothetical protein [Candidatus Gottesmanbacteria bacterium]